jgi:hypothetical protein
MTADMFAPYAARFAPVAIIPMHTPEEAIEELEYAVGKLGYRAIMLKETRSVLSRVQRKASMRRKPHGTSTPSPSTARLITIRSGGAALILASP